MKLKYKKIIFIISFGAMFIGLVVFSMIPSRNKEKPSGAHQGSDEPVNAEGSVTENPPDELSIGGNLKKNAYPEINDLIQRYFDAKMRVDMQAMETLVSDIGQVDVRKLQAQLEYIEGMENIQCYTFDGVEEGTYRVYVYHELKIRNIETLAPALTGLYVTQNSEGSYVIYLSSLDEEAQTFIEGSDHSEEAIHLTEQVRLKLEEALNKDAQLKEFYDMLEQGSENGEPSNDTSNDAGGADGQGQQEAQPQEQPQEQPQQPQEQPQE